MSYMEDKQLVKYEGWADNLPFSYSVTLYKHEGYRVFPTKVNAASYFEVYTHNGVLELGSERVEQLLPHFIKFVEAAKKAEQQAEEMNESSSGS